MLSGRSIRKKLGKRIGTTAQIAAQTAKMGLDQVLLSLQHKNISIKDPHDIIQSVGRKVLERAEAIRSQLATNPLSPSWLKDINLSPVAPNEAHAGKSEAASTTAEKQSKKQSSSAHSTSHSASHAGGKLTDNIEAELGEIEDLSQMTLDFSSPQPAHGDSAGSIIDATISEPAEQMQPESFEEAEEAFEAKAAKPARKGRKSSTKGARPKSAMEKKEKKSKFSKSASRSRE